MLAEIEELRRIVAEQNTWVISRSFFSSINILPSIYLSYTRLHELTQTPLCSLLSCIPSSSAHSFISLYSVNIHAKADLFFSHIFFQ